MKTTIILFTVLSATIFIGCKKDNVIHGSIAKDNYSSLGDFFSKNSPKIQTYTINPLSGGSFTTLQGTTVNIPANAFINQTGNPVTGNVQIEFLDVYKKSDMLLSNMPAMLFNGAPLKSGGEFFIKATINSEALILANGKKITISQPGELTGGIDSLNPMQAFANLDSIMVPGPSFGNFVSGWTNSSTDTVFTSTSNYIYSLYQFNSPVDSGSWCNSDNSTFFNAYPQTLLTLLPDDSVGVYGTNTFLIFSNISSMVHVNYFGSGYGFPYYYAPQGMQCTLVAIGVKDGELYSTFLPINIGSNTTVHFSLSKTTTDEFITQLNTLN